MQKRLIPACILIAYSALLVKLLVFKINLVKIGHMRFKFTDHGTGPANFVPFKTILPYLRGEHGWFIAAINLVGNMVLFAPIGLIVPFVWRKMTWRNTFILAVGSGLAIEGMETVFRVGIFDIDDIILNGLGVMIGYYIFRVTWASVRAQRHGCLDDASNEDSAPL
jgi:glycopeptide antibiotics resistance protein